MYVYIRTESELFTVGFYNPQERFQPESDHGSKEEAAARVAYLNGAKQNTGNESFTKFEKAAIMIAQGYVANQLYNDKDYDAIARWSVAQAKAVIEEANK